VAAEKKALSFSSCNELLAGLDPRTLTAWSELYPDQDFLRRETIKAWEYYRMNDIKRPRTIRGWTRALGSWFERGWPRHVREIKGKQNEISIAKILEEEKNSEGRF
jgi:hypothetical protein